MKTKNNPRQDPRCPSCHGQFSVGGTFTRSLPVGFGFAPGSDKFRVDRLVIRYYTGFCLDCGKDGKVEISRRHTTSYPSSINRKIQNAQKGL